MTRRILVMVAVGLCLAGADLLRAHEQARLVFDQAHGEQPPPSQLDPIAKKLGLELQTSAGSITPEILKGARILFLRAPSNEFTAAEAEAIVAFVKGGGSLLLVLDEERRQPWKRPRSTTSSAPSA